ncbi:ATP-binding protein [Streptomyces griseoaurantiacus]|uniref:ATP-binding protein n=1 Tax=Streptomyces griseoaurantiacus TaxID=68213 RepID=UPI00352F855C
MASVTPPARLETDAEDRKGLHAVPGVRPEATAEHRFRFQLSAHPGSVARARQLTRQRLSDWGACGDTCDSAALIVSELVTNAIVHTASENVVCELRDDAELVRIAVCDEGCAPGEPHPSPRRPEEEHGRGLLLVEALCRAWGAQETGPGLLVWAELPRRADVPVPRDLSCSGDRSRPDSPEDAAVARREPAAPPASSTPDTAPARPAREQETSDPGASDAPGTTGHARPGREPSDGSPAAGGAPGTRPTAGPAPAHRTAPPPAPHADLGWSAKKPPAEGGRGEEAEAFRDLGSVDMRSVDMRSVWM